MGECCRKFWCILGAALPTRLAVLLIPWMHDPSKLYLIVKANNQAFQWYKNITQIGFIKGKKLLTELMFTNICLWNSQYNTVNVL